MPVFRSPREAYPIRVAPRRINDHDSFPFPMIFSPLTPTSPEEDGMMNRTMDRTRGQMLNHNARSPKLDAKTICFYNGYRSYVSTN